MVVIVNYAILNTCVKKKVLIWVIEKYKTNSLSNREKK